MKGRRRYSTSSEESAVSAESAESDSEASSGSDVSESASDERSRRREKKHKRHAPSSDSDSEEETRRRAKKRKHKKKKRKHAKKRRRDESEEESSESKEEEEHKRSRKHRHDKQKYKSVSRSPSVQEVPVTYPERPEKKERAVSGNGGVRLQSVVQGRRRSGSRDHHRSRSPHPHRYYEQDERKHRLESEEYHGRPREAEVDRFYRGSSKDRSLRSHRPSRYEVQERFEREHYSGGHEYDDAPARDERVRGGIQHNYSHRPQKYEQQEYERSRDDSYYRERAQRDRGEYNGRPNYSQHDDRVRHQPEKAGPVCLVCEEVHAGRVCRAAPAPASRNLGHYRQHDADRRDKHAPVKRERERSERERGHREEKEERREREERRVDREERRSEKEMRPPRRERSRPSSPRREPTREPRIPSRREPPAKSPRREEVRRPRDSTRDDRSDGDRKRGADKYEVEKRGRVDREGIDKRESEHSPRHREKRSRFDEEDGKNYTWGKTEVKKESEPGEKDKPNFALSGALAADTNMVNGILLKYSEPPDAKQPKRRWRFYPFKGDKSLPILFIHRQSCFVFGRDHKAVDIPLEHPSVSKQHAALQYRATPYERPDGTLARRVRPYIIDLDSANGTFVNNKKVEARRYVELLERDVIKFGFSQREYVLLHENSKENDAADENQDMALASETGVTSIATVKREKQKIKELVEDGE